METADDAAQQDLMTFMTLMSRHAPATGWLLNRGRFWTPAPSPIQYGRGPLGECYANSLLLAARHPELTYVEGQATGAFGMAMMHAWCVDPAGTVVDVTWDDPQERGYFGVAFDTLFARALTVRQQYYGLLANDWLNDNQIMTQAVVTDLNDHGIEVIIHVGEA